MSFPREIHLFIPRETGQNQFLLPFYPLTLLEGEVPLPPPSSPEITCNVEAHPGRDEVRELGSASDSEEQPEERAPPPGRHPKRGRGETRQAQARE